MKKTLTYFKFLLERKWNAFTLRPSLLFILVIMCACTMDKTEDVINNDALLGIGYGISHASFLVKNLKETRDYYVDTLGFDMPNEDRFKKNHVEGALTVGINFPGMTSIEFLSIEDSLVSVNTPSYITDFLTKYQGVQQYSLSSSSVDTTYSWLSDKGFKMDTVESYRTSAEPVKGWSRDPGGSQERSLYFKGRPGYFPNFVERINTDYNKMEQMWKTYYGYGRSFSNHPNGVIGMASLQIAVDSLDAVSEKFKKMGLIEMKDGVSRNSVRFKVKRQQELELKSSSTIDDEVSKFLQERGTGVFSIRFEVKNLDSTYHFFKSKLPTQAVFLDSLQGRITINRAYANGVQLEFINESEAQALMAQELKIGGKLDSVGSNKAAGMYQKYCALCHGDNREGYAADNAPSLRSHSLLGTSKASNFLRYTVQYGRAGTAMAGYLDTQGGPMEYIEIELMLQWLYENSGIEEPIEISRDPVVGDVALGSEIYTENCVICHGSNGEGVSAPALGNPMLLATATDEFLKYAIKEGRDGTPMMGFKDVLNEDEINSVTAFLRSRASGWDIPNTESVNIPSPENYVLNPNGKAPTFELREGLYVASKQVYEAMQDSSRMIILDARSEVAWRQTHIPGSIPVPYYKEPEEFVNDLPNDDTWIVAYCACPHAASGRVVNSLRRYGYKNTAIIDEGVLVWAQLGYPTKSGQ